jgi:hypothetical protein
MSEDLFLMFFCAGCLVIQVFYHLGELDDSLTYALGAGDLFDLNDDSEYTSTLVGRFLLQPLLVDSREVKIALLWALSRGYLLSLEHFMVNKGGILQAWRVLDLVCSMRHNLSTGPLTLSHWSTKYLLRQVRVQDRYAQGCKSTLRS